MRSKWLDWQPSPEIIQKRKGGEPSKPTEPRSEGFVGSPSGSPSITRELLKTEKTAHEELSGPQLSFPSSTILLAPRYDGGNKPLASVPRCWCCAGPWRLERIQKSKAKTYAFLEPSCGCLDARVCYRCFACRTHCQCTSEIGTNTTHKTSREDFRTATGDTSSQ